MPIQTRSETKIILTCDNEKCEKVSEMPSGELRKSEWLFFDTVLNDGLLYVEKTSPSMGQGSNLFLKNNKTDKRTYCSLKCVQLAVVDFVQVLGRDVKKSKNIKRQTINL